MSFTSSRRNSSAKGNPVSLFPFLAVLLCTMGSLLGVLLIMADLAKHERQEALNEQQEELAQKEEEKSVVSEDVEKPDYEQLLAQIEEKKKQIRDIQEQLNSRLRASRLALSGIETELGDLRTQVELLRNDALKLGGQLEALDTEFLKEQLASMESELADKKKELEGLREKNRDTKPGLAVIPHKGQYNTNRYPIYVVCTSHGVVLQPEEIYLTASDFACNLSLGSPLEAAMRAKREYLLKQNAFDPVEDGEPYPLILVRPDGIEYYYAARMAISAFGDDFGYKLIGEKQADDLVYPPEDSEMTAAIQEAVDRARINMREMAKMAPAMEGSANDPVAYRVNGAGAREAISLDGSSRVAEVLRNSRSGGNPGVGAGGVPGGAPGAASAVNSGSYGTGFNSTGYGTPGNPDNGSIVMGSPDFGGGNIGSTGLGGQYFNGTNNGGISNNGGLNSQLATGSSPFPPGGAPGASGFNSPGQQDAEGFTSAGLGGLGAGQYNPNAGGRPGSGSTGVYLPLESTQNETAKSVSNSVFGGLTEAENIDPSSNALGSNPLLTGTGRNSSDPVGVKSVTAKAPTSGQRTGQAGQAGQQSDMQYNPLLPPPPEVPPIPGQQGSQTATLQNSTSRPVTGQMGMAYTDSSGKPQVAAKVNVDPAEFVKKDSEHDKHQRSLSQRLGPNWAVPEHHPRALSISRAVRVDVEPDCFVVYPAMTSEKPIRLPFYGNVSDTVVEGLIRTVRGQTSAWGDAGTNSYWKPYLKLSVKPGAEPRVKELRSALTDSGVEIEQ
ncbi:MAG: hypothetical protein IJG38_11450 [Thermoguttaceae bacterium]|nr:hypothetical protein [Thermoguttaceae bacterium]